MQFRLTTKIVVLGGVATRIESPLMKNDSYYYHYYCYYSEVKREEKVGEN